MPALLFDGPESSPLRLVLAHGAGAGMSSPFMSAIAAELAARGVRVARFEFPYMLRRKRGVRAPPDRMPLLLDSYRAVVSQLGAAPQLVIGGKSLGGRVASMLADELGVAGLVCLGYPFHSAKRPERTRTEHLLALKTRTLIVQGTRDALGSRDDVAGYALAKRIRLTWIEDGDHSLAPRRTLGHDPVQAFADACAAVMVFMRALPAFSARTQAARRP
jgi:predicted alpha/beta-hydrolase family hydrolase